MDRDTTIALAASIIVLTLIGGIYLSPTGKAQMSPLEARAAAAGAQSGIAMEMPPSSEPAKAVEEAPAPPSSKFLPEDIRYKYQQAALKDGKKRKFLQAAPVDSPSEASENEEPSAEEPSNDEGADESAEEPDLEN